METIRYLSQLKNIMANLILFLGFHLRLFLDVLFHDIDRESFDSFWLEIFNNSSNLIFLKLLEYFKNWKKTFQIAP